MRFSKIEKVDIVSVFIKSNQNQRLARREYRRLYPNRGTPCEKTFVNLYKRLRNSGSLKRKYRNVRRNEDDELNILLYFQENPSKSIRDCSRDLQYSYSKVQKTLKKYYMHDFKYTKVQQLSELDKQRRSEFCRSMLRQLAENPDFFNRILWTDESNFNTACPPNLKSLHFWAAENPRKTLEVKRSGRQSIGVWCGIIKNRVIGKIFYNGSLTGARYLELLQTQIEEEINMPPLNIFRNLIWQQDGAPAHSVLAVREYLNANYNMWIGRNGTIIWPPNSPDLTPLDTFLWGYLKSKVYMDRTQNIEDIIMKIVEEIDDLNNHPEIINRTIENLIKRYRLCVEVNGAHFEQFL